MSDAHPIRPGAEPTSHEGDDAGVLVLHGFTGNPGTMRLVTGALVDAGCTVEAPRLPGHGTHLDDMLKTGWAEWSTAADHAFTSLAARREKVVVVGLSMGGTLAAWLAGRHGDRVAGIVLINPAVMPPDPEQRQLVVDMLDAGEAVVGGLGSDIADPDAVEDAYVGTPLAPLLTLLDGNRDDVQPVLPSITCPILLMTSPQDHVVDPAASDHLVSLVSGPVERVSLDRSFHVATLDHDRDLIIERTIDFVRKVTSTA